MAVLNEKSRKKLTKAEPRLASLIADCIERAPFAMSVTETVRSKEQQAQNVRKGVSKTMNSYHIPRDGEDFSRAVDVAIFNPDGSYCADLEQYRKFADTVLAEADKRGLKVTWGGNWKTLCDGPHFQIEL